MKSSLHVAGYPSAICYCFECSSGDKVTGTHFSSESVLLEFVKKKKLLSERLQIEEASAGTWAHSTLALETHFVAEANGR